MIATSTIQVISGSICLVLVGLMIYQAKPREGKPTSAWTKTDFRATSAALLLMALLLAGVTLLIKGLF